MIRRTTLLGLGAAVLANALVAAGAPSPTPTPEAKPAPPTAAPVPGDPNEIRRINVEETNALRESGKGVIVDVRDAGSYSVGHIKGALSIPLADLPQRLAELPRDKPIITYCS